MSFFGWTDIPVNRPLNGYTGTFHRKVSRPASGIGFSSKVLKASLEKKNNHSAFGRPEWG